MRRLGIAFLLAGCPALYSPNLPDLAAPSADLAVEVPPDLAAPTVRDPCFGVCGAGERCVFGCRPPANACDLDSCPSGFTCLDGACQMGCLPDRCAGVTCPSGQRCARDGHCRPIFACDRACPADTECIVWCLPGDVCSSVGCDSGQTCKDGICVEDPCAGLSCPPPTVCVEGACVDSCNPPAAGPPGGCDGACSIGRACVGGACRIKRCDPGCSCLEDCVDGSCLSTCLPPNQPCGCDCCPATMVCGPDGHCHGPIP